MCDIMVIVRFSIKFESKGVTYTINIIDKLRYSTSKTMWCILSMTPKYLG